jgi:hypothetical protein
MLRTSIIKTARAVAAPRYFSASALRMAEGATGSGASRPTGVAGGYESNPTAHFLNEAANEINRDAFTKREKAAEELYIRQEEKAKYVSSTYAPRTAGSPAYSTRPS